MMPTADIASIFTNSAARIGFLFYILTLPAPCILENCFKAKINFIFCFHTWCLKKFYESENKNVS